jgi:hypothetical protein
MRCARRGYKVHCRFIDAMSGLIQITRSTRLTDDHLDARQLIRNSFKEKCCAVLPQFISPEIFELVCDGLQHRITAVTGAVARTNFAGWFVNDDAFALTRIAKKSSGQAIKEIEEQ